MTSENRAGRIEAGDCYAGSLYESDGFSLDRFFEGIFSRVEISDEAVEALKDLSRKGVVVYAQKNASQLNALLLKNVLVRKGIEHPIYCHGVNMMLWQPFLTALRCFFSRLFNVLFKKNSLDPYKTQYLKRITKSRKSSLIYLRESEIWGNPFVRDPFAQLLQAQSEMQDPVFVVPVVFSYGKRREKKDRTLFEILFGQLENPGALRRVVQANERLATRLHFASGR